jgi:hypothetical protein
MRQGDCMRALTQGFEGLRYHQVTIGAEVFDDPKGRRRFKYRCDCGVEKTTFLQHIKARRPKSCGCQTHAILSEVRTIHGMEGSVEYTAWKHMKARCTLRTRADWPHYGGRGISFDARWLKFQNFFLDMGLRPDGMSLDRIDVNGDYCKENCRWATASQQANNKRDNHRITAFGQTLTAAEWAAKIGIRSDTLRRRILRWKMTPEQALSPRDLRLKGHRIHSAMCKLPSGKRVAVYSL